MRFAIFGGTFDPIHKAHLEVGREAAARFDLEQVLFIPAAHPPHKVDSTAASYEDRYRMVELACAVEARFVPSRIEEGEGKSYSIYTIEKLWSPDRLLYFIIGADAFADIATWHRWKDVIRLTDFIVVTRPGHEYKIPEGARVRRLETAPMPVSSSEIRQRLAAGIVPDELPEAVTGYIIEHGLYGWPRPRRER